MKEQRNTIVRVGHNIIIKPAGIAYDVHRDDIIINIEAGGAFGSGKHPATRMCLMALENIASQNMIPEKWNALDVGTGTGILAICAARLGAETVLAIDIDPKACGIATENVALNGLKNKIKVADGDITVGLGAYNVILANLYTLTLLEIKSQLLSRVKHGGYIIMSGIMEHNRENVLKTFESGEIELYTTRQEDKWVCYVFVKKTG